jgi:hypothetical protein
MSTYRTVKHFVGLAGATALTVATGCGAESSLFVLGVITPDDQCLFSPDPDSMIGTGTLDVDALPRTPAAGYMLPLLVRNNQANEANALAPATAQDVRITGASVRFDASRDEQVDPFVSTRRVSVDKYVPADQDAPVTFIAIDRARIEELASNVPDADTRYELVLRVKLTGKSLDGDGVESNEFKWNISVCRGCRVAPGCETASRLFGCLAGQEGFALCGADAGAE